MVAELDSQGRPCEFEIIDGGDVPIRVSPAEAHLADLSARYWDKYPPEDRDAQAIALEMCTAMDTHISELQGSRARAAVRK